MLNTEILVSVVIPCYNHEKYVQECIKSIIAQDYKNIELIIIDDGSKDGSVKKIIELVPICEKRFTRFEFRSRPNKGLCATLNEAIQWCSGDFFSTIASDDMMLANKTSRQIAHFIKNPSCDAVFGGVVFINEKGNITGRKNSVTKTVGFKELILVQHTLFAPTQMLRLSKLRAAGKYPVGFYIEDLYMWLKLSSLGSRIDDIGEALVAYRMHDSNASGNLEKMNAARNDLIDMYKKHPLYKQAKATSLLSSAMDMQPISKLSSMKYLYAGLMISITLFSDKRFYRYLFKLLIPYKYIDPRRK